MTPITLTVPAAGNTAGVASFHQPGKYFLITAMTGPVRVLTNNGEEYDFSETGSGFGNDVSNVFGALTFYNDAGAPVVITFYVSLHPIKTPDVNVTSTVSVTTVLSNTLASCAVENEGQLQAASGAGGAAARFAAVGTYFRRAIIIAQKTLDRGANTGIVYIGNSAAHQSILLNPGDQYSIEADTGGKRDFGSWYVSADNAGDGVSVLYV